MILTIDEAKEYLRVDVDEDDQLIETIIDAASQLVKDVARLDDEELCTEEILKTAILYTCAYLYEHREEADHKDLTLTLRALLFGVREARF